MLFSSGFFLMVFLPITMILYKLVSATKKSYSNLVLIVASLFFYSWGEPFFILILMGSIVINYFCGIGIETGKHRKLILILSLIVNIGILFIFKYLSFLAGEIASLFNINTLVVDISLPIGISFYTFQIMSYIFDVYYSKVPAQRNMAKLTLYIMMFPQLIAGPIVRYNDIVYQIDHREESFEKFYYGMLRFIVGLSKKVLIADFLGGIADKIFITSEYSAVPMITAWIGALAYTLEIYYDFSGYSDMAIGLGKCFGFDFKENFNYPYTACSLTDFWRRWHMSLTDWFRDYVYIPLGGNRVTPGRHILNLFCVWLLTGIWHGANWTFVAWGLIYFILLVIEKYLGILKNFL